MFQNNEDDSRELDSAVVRPLMTSPAPPDHLANRVVRALHATGFLRGSATHREGSPLRKNAARRVIYFVGAAAAASLLFVTGFQIGEKRGRTVAMRAALSSDADTSVTSRVRESAAQFIATLLAVDPTNDSAATAADAAMQLAAAEMIRISPRSDISVAMQIAFPAASARRATARDGKQLASNLIWY